jgi:hypothetical protein
LKLDLQDCSHTETTKCKVIVFVVVGRFFNCICNAVDDKELEDTNGVIRIRKSKKDEQHNGQKKKDKQRSIKHTHKRADKIQHNGQNLKIPKG